MATSKQPSPEQPVSITGPRQTEQRNYTDGVTPSTRPSGDKYPDPKPDRVSRRDGNGESTFPENNVYNAE